MECNIIIDWEDLPLLALTDVCHYEVMLWKQRRPLDDWSAFNRLSQAPVVQ